MKFLSGTEGNVNSNFTFWGDIIDVFSLVGNEIFDIILDGKWFRKKYNCSVILMIRSML